MLKSSLSFCVLADQTPPTFPFTSTTADTQPASRYTFLCCCLLEVRTRLSRPAKYTSKFGISLTGSLNSDLRRASRSSFSSQLLLPQYATSIILSSTDSHVGLALIGSRPAQAAKSNLSDGP